MRIGKCPLLASVKDANPEEEGKNKKKCAKISNNDIGTCGAIQEFF
jgi:hypothetical protein